MKAEIGKKKEADCAGQFTQVREQKTRLSQREVARDGSREEKIISHPQVQVHALPTHTHTHTNSRTIFFFSFSCGIKTKSEAKRRSCVKVRTVNFSHFCYFGFFPLKKILLSRPEKTSGIIFSFDIPHPKIKVSYPSIYLLCMGIVIREEKTNKKVSNIFFGEL